MGKIFCGECGAGNEFGSKPKKFCNKCGEPLDSEVSASDDEENDEIDLPNIKVEVVARGKGKSFKFEDIYGTANGPSNKEKRDPADPQFLEALKQKAQSGRHKK